MTSEEEDGSEKSAAEPQASAPSVEIGNSVEAGAAFFTYVAVDVCTSLLLSKVLLGTHIVSQSLACLQSLVQIVIGVVSTLALEGPEPLWGVLTPRVFCQFAVPAVMFAIAQCCKLVTYTFLSAAVIKIVGQVRLVQTALLSTFLLKHKYTRRDWVMMLHIVLAAMAYFVARGNSGGIDDSPTAAAGLLFLLVHVFLTDIGYVLFERLMKKDMGTGVNTQKVAIEMAGLPVSFILSFLLPAFLSLLGSPNNRGRWWNGKCYLDDGSECEPGGGACECNQFFLNWDHAATWLALMFATAGSLLSAVLVKRMSSVARLLAKSISLSIVYFLGDCWLNYNLDHPPTTIQHMCAISVVMGTVAFLDQ